MRAAHQVVGGACYDPQAVKALCQAFDQAWGEIAGAVGDDPQSVQVARLKLADAILSVASEDSRDADVLKTAALAAMECDQGRREALVQTAPGN